MNCKANMAALAVFCAAAAASADVVAVSPDGVWQVLDAVPAAAKRAQPWIRPQVFAPAVLNWQNLGAVLRDAPLEGTVKAAREPLVMWMPQPDGTFGRFSVVESPIMEPGLAIKFPSIRTYLGQGIDDPAAIVRFDSTPQGFHSQVLSPSGAVYIDPYSRGDTTLYSVYSKADYKKAADGWECLTPADERPWLEGGPDVPSGDTLRTYRLAVAATGEYTAFHGGTVAAGMAAIVTAVNRVTGVYEREFSVRLVLVANNNLVVYTNSGTDPYTNNNGSTMLGQNQTTLDSVIGSANYDVGHVFSTGGGGVAQLRVPCVGGSKARGVTGLPSPTGDPFYIDYVAHEMGHQFGANHTFNSSTGSCGGNRSSGSAYEPGSASTIMGYAGICGADNLQSNSDAYFVHRSYDEIRSFVTGATGASCGTSAATGNNWPTVSAGASYTIPKQTPFALTASGSDPNGDTVSFCWEERDLGASITLGAGDNGSSPIIRSFTGSTNPTRTIPRLSNLLNNTFALGEILPNTNRTMNFRVTARDNRAGGGGVNTADMAVAVTTSSGPFLVTSPNTAVSWSGLQTVTWAVAGTTSAPVSCANVSILLSTDGGNTFPTILAGSVPNTGSAQVTMPNLSTTQARIKVAAVGNIFFDISNVNFTITAAAGPANNACGAATVISVGSTPFTTVGATTDGPTEAGCNFCCSDPQVNQDVWYRYTAACTGQATVDLCDATFDSKVAVYQGQCPTGPDTALACNDDACGTGGTRSRVSWQATAGQVYTIRVGGFTTATGTGTLVLTCAACYANCDGSTIPPILNVNDFICFQTKFAAGDPYANCDGSTVPPVLNVSDFTCFLNLFAAGCP